jgi:hypothetical protein
MTAEEYEQWKVYLSYEPPNTNEIQLAVLIAAVTSFAGGKKKARDFIISRAPRAKSTITGEELNNLIKGMF